MTRKSWFPSGIWPACSKVVVGVQQERKTKQKVVPTSATPYPLCQEGLYSLPGGTQRLVKAAPGVLQFFSHFTGWAEICRPSELPHQHFHQNLWQKNKERASGRKQLRQEHFISLSFFLLLFNSWRGSRSPQTGQNSPLHMGPAEMSIWSTMCIWANIIWKKSNY